MYKKFLSSNLIILRTSPFFFFFNFLKINSIEIREPPPSLVINLAEEKGVQTRTRMQPQAANENILTAERQLLNRRFYSLISRLR